MADDDDTKGIPSWQRRDSSDSSLPPDLKEIEPRPESDTPSEPDATTAETREDLIAQASTWLEHPHIRDAPTEGKISFLEGKGLTKDETNKLLGLEDTAHTGAVKSTDTTDASHLSADTTATPSSKDLAVSEQGNNVLPTQSEASASSDGPPIITYPEFLLKPPPKPPLISRTAIANTLYATAITAGALHLTSEYLVTPLLSQLADARHDLFSTTSTKLDALNSKLSEVVSHVPAAALVTHHKRSQSDSENDSETSSASDPAELFHRDIGIQTSPPSSPDAWDSDRSVDSPGGTTEAQSSKLGRLRAQLAGLVGATEMATEAERETATAIDGLDQYLDGVRFGSGKTGLGTGGQGLGLPDGMNIVGGEKTNKTGEASDDEIDRVKREIKAVKGVLLSARSFPSSLARANAAR